MKKSRQLNYFVKSNDRGRNHYQKMCPKNLHISSNVPGIRRNTPEIRTESGRMQLMSSYPLGNNEEVLRSMLIKS